MSLSSDSAVTLPSTSFDVFRRVLRERNQDVVFVLHRPNCSDCRDFIRNPFMNLKDNVKMVKVYVNKKQDMTDLKKLIQINDKTQWPVIVVMKRGHGILKKMYQPTWENVHEAIRKMRNDRPPLAKTSLRKLESLLSSDSHTRELTPLGSSVPIAMDIRQGASGNMVCLHRALSGNCLVMFKRDGCGYCRKLMPHYERLAKSPLAEKLGMYVVDTDHHFDIARQILNIDIARKILKEDSEHQRYPDGLVNMPGVPVLALFKGKYAPKLIQGRTYDDIRTEVKDAMENIFIDIFNPETRVKFEDIKGKNAAVLFIDWRHKPCLNMVNKLRKAVELLGDKKVPVYVFNVRNHVDMWDTISHNYKINNSGVELEVHTIPQIIYFYNRRRVPSLRKDVSRLDVNQLAMDLSNRYNLGFSVNDTGLRRPEEMFNEFDTLKTFAGGSTKSSTQIEAQLQGMLKQLETLTNLVQNKI